MPKFVLVEHSLRKVGGHYFPYAFDISTAAEKAGFEIVLAVNREFDQVELFPANWKVIPLFPRRAQRIHRQRPVAGQDNEIMGRRLQRLMDFCSSALRGLRGRFKQRRLIAEFTAACEELFAQVPLEPGDLVYFSTFGDMDLLGLADFLEAHPETRRVSWHMQLHAGVFDGRDPEFAGQTRMAQGLRDRFAAVRARLPEHDLTYHCPSEPLTRQYQLLGETSARTLPWPVGPELYSEPSPAAGYPLRLVMAGALRREQGGRVFASLFRSVERANLQGRQLRFLVQSSRRRREQDLAGLPCQTVDDLTLLRPDRLPNSPILTLPHPLDREDYLRVFRSADLGLMLHSAEAYVSRASGVLVELLAAAVPVVVMAGGWINDQIQGANDAWLNRLTDETTVLHRWHSATSAIIDPSGEAAAAELDFVPTGADLLVRVGFSAEQGPGCYARIELEQFGADGHPLNSFCTIVGARPEREDGVRPAALFHLRPNAVRARLQVASAYIPGRLRIAELEIDRITSADGSHQPLPMGRVGLGATNLDAVPYLIQDLVTHYEHYLEGARRFAEVWRYEHAADRSIEILTGQA